MLIFLNGRLVPEAEALVSVHDRGFLYGDGLFETLRVLNGKPFRWNQHMVRLQKGATFLKIELPFSAGDLRLAVDELVSENHMPDALLRLTLSRGRGVRGYSPRAAERPTVVMGLHPAPGTPDARPAVAAESPRYAVSDAGAPIGPRWRLITSSQRLPASEPLAQFKTCNKLPQILAHAEADAAGVDEALLWNSDGFVVEGTGANLFWIDGDTVCTPPVSAGVLPGVTRAVVLEISSALGLENGEANVAPEELNRMAGVFVTLSSRGVVEAEMLDGHTLKRSVLTETIRRAYLEWLQGETA